MKTSLTRTLTGCALVVLSLQASAAPVRQNLWPEGKIPDFRAEQIAAPLEEAKQPGFDRAAHRMPYLEWSDAPVSNRTDACVILISGGGYECTCDGPAFRPLEKKLLDNGITCVWLWYRTPRPSGAEIYRSGWQDGQRAVRLVRAAAKERGFDPEKIGVLGCSAGSHLSVMLATSALTPAYERVDATDDVPCHVNWAIPMCVAYALTDGLEGANARAGDSPDLKLNPSFAFDKKTAPMCLFHGGLDPYSPNGSTQLYRELRRKKVPAELHLDPGRGHGPVDAEKFERAIEFMRQLGCLGPVAREVDVMTRFTEADGLATFEKIPLWPEGKMPDVRTNQCAPFLEWAVPKELKTKAIQIVYAGGCYNRNNEKGSETLPVRRYLNAKGMTVVTMKYRTPRPQGLAKHISAWQDLQRAIRTVRAEAAKRGLDPDRIGIMGASAGGHLTLMGATSSRHLAYLPVDEIDRISCRPQWAIALYPAYALTDGAERPNSGNADAARLVPEFSFDLDTCPILFLHGDADVWASMNSVKCWEQLRRMGIQGELHTLVTRNHCFQNRASPGTGSYTWLDRIDGFLRHGGFLGEVTK